MSLFSLFIHFELLLTEHLRAGLRGRDPLGLVSLKRVAVINSKWTQFNENKLEQDIFNAMDICDKREVASRLEILGKSKNAIVSSISDIERYLRNPIAHGAEYAISKQAAYRTVRAAQATRDWIVDLRRARTSSKLATPQNS